MKKQSKKLLSILLSVMMLVGFVPLAALPVANAADVWDGTWDGSGFSNNHITSAKGLAQFINNAGTGTSYSGQTVWLDVDIDLNNIDFGNISGGKNVYYSRDNYFQGTFDGQGHTIANFRMHNSDHRIGLFRSARNATFKNITFTNAFIDDNDNNKKNGFAVVVGFGEGNLTFENVHIASGTVYGYNYVGGLVGEYGANETLRFTNCSNAAMIHADNDRAAGLVGHSKGSVVANGCSNTGEIYAAYSDAGGIAGWIEDDESSFVNCSNTGKVSTDACAGGIFGYFGSKSNDNKMTITGCSNTGYIESRAKTAGGIAGMMDTDAEHAIESNVNRGDVYGREDAGGIVGSNIGAGVWRNDKNYGSVSCTNDNAGGICGDVEDDMQKFYNCYNTGAVTGKNSIGGVLGYGQNANHEFYDCGNSGAITSTSDAAGGIFGYGNESEPTIEQCWNVGSVNAYNDAGGILGHTAHHSYIRRCFNAGAIGTYNHDNSGAHGGIAGQTSDKSGSSNDNPNMTDCVNWGTVSGGWDDGGLIGKIKDGRTPYYITNSYNAGQVTGGRPFAIIAYGGNVGNNVYYDNGKTMGTVQGNSISDSDLKNSSGFSGNYCKNTWGVKIGSTTYYYPILTWYRNLFVFNLKFVDSPSGTNAYFDGNYGAGFTSPNPSRTGYTCGDWYDENNANRKMARNTLIWCGTSAPTDTMTVTQHVDEVTKINNETTFRLTWTPNPYTIHFNGNGSTHGMMENLPMVYDTAKNLPERGYFREYTVTYNYNYTGKADTSETVAATFDGWARSADGAKEFNNKQSVNNLTSELNGTVELYAKWTLNSVTLPTPTREGYDFGGWFEEAGCATKIGEGGASYTPTANKTLFAKWTPVEYTVTYDGNGATSGSTADSTHVYDTAKNLTENGFERKYTVTYHYNAPGKDDTSAVAAAAFNGWATSADGAKQYDDGQSVLNLRNTAGAFPLFADWTVSSVTLPKPARDGYQFGGWYGEAALTSFVGNGEDSYTPAADKELFARWEANSYKVHFNGNGATSGEMADQDFTFDAQQALTENAFKKEYTVSFNHKGGAGDASAAAEAAFNGWAVSENGDSVYADQETVSNLTAVNNGVANLWAVWAPMGDVTLPASVKEGCAFEGWYSDAELTEKVGDAGDSYVPASDGVTLYAKHTTNTYQITFLAADGTTVLDKQTVNYNETPTAPDIPGKAPTATQHFTGAWDKAVVPATETAAYTVVYTGSDHFGGSATCLEKAVCDACGTAYGKLGGHALTEVPAEAPSCLAPGHVAYWTCAVCGKNFTDNFGAEEIIDYQNAHTWDEGNVTTAATCKAEGVKTFTCTVCGTTREEPVAVDPANHADYGTELKNEKAATCKENGYTGDTVCKGCGATLAEGTVIDKSTVDHTWDQGEVTTAATCKEAGVKTFTCAVCEATRTEPVAVDPDNHADYGTELKNDKAATCKEDGYTGDTVCKGCGATLAEGTVIDKSTVEHTWDQGKVTTAATCKEAGVKTFTCAVCEATRTEPVAVDPANHADYGTELKNDKAATCKEDGYTGDTVCKGCGATLASGTVIDKSTVDHTWDQGEVTTAATCKEAGVKTFTCTVCGVTREDPVAVDPDNHADYGTEVKNDKAATCKEDGYTGDTVCKGCGATLEAGTVIDKSTVDHTWDQGEVTTAATCKEAGVKTFTCAVCEATRTEPVAVDPDNHADYGTELKNDKAATCKEDGYTGDTVCKGCGATLVSGTVIDKSTVDHTWDQGEVTTAATCKEAGVKTFTCAVCEATRTEPVAVDPDNHAGGTKTESRNATGATCITPGSYDCVVVCLGCGHDLSITHMEGVTDPNTHEGATETKEENIVPGTCNAERAWNEVVYCLSCGQVISTTPKTGEKDPANHTGGTEVRGAVTATCTVEGYTGDTWCLGCETMIEEGETTGFGAHQAEYTEAVTATCKDTGFAAYWYCPVCGNYYLEETMTDPLTRAQLDEQGKVDKLTVHTPGAAHQENPVDATCTREGSYDEVVRCTVCNLVLESAHRTVDKLAHTPGGAVKENEVPASCDADGGYDLVVRCTVCGEAISSTHQTVPAGHTAGEPIRENENDPTCTQAGSYDAVVYCTQCGEEISRETVAVPAKGHSWGEWQVTIPATEETDGEARRVCTACGETETKVIEASGEELTRLIKFVNINKMHYLVDLGDGETYAVYNSSTIQWISDKPLRFSVVTYSGFNYEDVIVYANGKALTPDADGYYTLQKSDETVVITAAGAVKDDSAPGGKLSFWELLIRFFKKIIDFFSGAFAK